MSLDNVYALILAGGKGERFWPASRLHYPKHFLKVFGKKSFLQDTFSRLKSFLPLGHILMVTTQDQVSLVKKQIPQLKDKNLIIEPMGRNTAAAIGLGSMVIDKLNDDPVIVALPSDHKIESKSDFISKVKQAISLAWEKKAIVTLGIRPTYPATGYGYIKTAFSVQRVVYRKDRFYKVDKFTEKPSLPLAKKFMKAKSYFWNSGIFIFPASVIVEEIKRYQPKLYSSLLKIEKIQSKRKITEIYSCLDNISIDYAIMEKTKRLYMIEANFNWDDVGSWDSLERYLPHDKYQNILSAIHKGIDTNGCMVISQPNHLIATLGLKDMLIVQTKDATLVCPKNRLDHVKKLVKSLYSVRQFKRYI